MEIRTTYDIATRVDFEVNQKWISVDDLHKRLSTVMNVRNNEKDMRLLIICIQQEYGKLIKDRKGEHNGNN